MYYVKDSFGNPIYLGEAPVFATCPECGAEHQFNELWTLLAEDDFDLHSSAYCDACTRKHLAEREGARHSLHLM